LVSAVRILPRLGSVKEKVLVATLADKDYLADAKIRKK
jgi:hypothetical protein